MFKFSIRDVLLITVIAAVGTAWGVDHARQAEEIQSLEQLLANSGDFDFKFSKGTWEDEQAEKSSERAPRW